MKLTILGSGLTVPLAHTKYRYPSSHLLKAGGKNILLDCGTGVLPQLAKLGIEINEIDAICITHYHADHFSIDGVLQAFMVLNSYDKKKTKLKIFGPPDIENRVKTSYRLRGWSFDDDLLNNTEVTFHPYEDEKKARIFEDIYITPYKTIHSYFDAYSIRIEHDNKVLAYSGDTSFTDDLVSAAEDSDLFLCEAATDIGQTFNDIHMSPIEAGQAALKAKSKYLVLTHYSGIDSESAMVKNVREAGFNNDVSVSVDLQEFKI